jgi:circadian clock protein KaiC
MHRDVDDIAPSVVVVDPLSSFTGATFGEINNMVMRLIDFLKGRNVTALFTHLLPGSAHVQDIQVGVSSLMDTWILLGNSPPGVHGGRRLSILKSRGMAHASEERLFELTDRGAVSIGPSKMRPAAGRARS